MNKTKQSKHIKHNNLHPLAAVASQIGFAAMTMASFMVVMHEIADKSSLHHPHAHTSSHNNAATVATGNAHEKMEEIRHHPHSYGSLMRSPSTAGSQ